MRGWVLALLFVLLSVPSVHALAISYDYLDHDTLLLSPGGTYYYRLVLQNEGDDALNVTVTIESPIATLIGPAELALPGQTFSTSVYLNITLPETATPGDRIPVRFIVAPASTEGDGGQVPFSVRYDRSITVAVDPNAPTPTHVDPVPVLFDPVEEPAAPEPRPWLAAIIIAAGVLVILVAGLLTWRFSRRKPRA